MKKTTQAWLLIILATFLLASTSPASAEIIITKSSNEFSLTTQALGTKLCACSNTEFAYRVENVGDVPGVFTAKVESEADWLRVENPSAYLEQGETREFKVLASPPCGFEGTTTYSVKVRSSYGREKSLSRTIQVVKCSDLVLEGLVTSAAVNPGELAVFKARVKNPSSFPDSYSATVDGAARLSEEEFNLGPGEEKELLIYAKYPSEEWGEKELNLKVSSQRNNEEESLKLKLRIKKAYKYKLRIESPAELCAGDSKSLRVSVKNLAGTPNKYKLSVEGVKATLEEEELSANPGEEASTLARINTRTGEPGVKKVLVKAVSEKGGVEATAETVLNVKDCYSFQASLPAEVINICSESTLEGVLRNTGVKESRYLVKADKSWASPARQELTVKPGRHASFKVKASPPCADSEEELKITVYDEEKPEFGKELRVKVKVYTPQTAYQLSLPVRNFKLRKGGALFKVPVRHEGILPADYQAELESDFLKLRTKKVKLLPGREGYLEVEANLSSVEPGEYLHRLTLKGPRGVTYEASIGTLVKEEPLATKAWASLKAITARLYGLGWCGLITALLLATTLLTGIAYAKARKKRVKRFKTVYKKRFAALKAGVIVVFLLAVLYFAAGFSTTKPAFYEEPSPSKPLLHQWFQDQEYEIDLDQYFYDPDRDVLSYTYEGGEHFTISIERGTAFIKPEEGWSGEENVTFKAIDEAGEAAEAEMTLKVLAKKQLSWADYWKENCHEGNALIAAIILALAFGIIDLYEPRGREYYFKKRRRGKKQATRSK